MLWNVVVRNGDVAVIIAHVCMLRTKEKVTAPILEIMGVPSHDEKDSKHKA